jgi:hypothetical protein
MLAPLYPQSLYGFWTHKWLHRVGVFTAMNAVFWLPSLPRLWERWIFRCFRKNCETRLSASSSPSVRPSVLPFIRMEQLGSHWTIFIKLIFEYFSKLCQENSSFITTGQEYRLLYITTTTHFPSHLTHFSLEWEMFQTKVVDKLKTHILCSVTLFDNRAVYETIRRNDVQWGRQYGACALHAGYPRLQTHTGCVLIIAFPKQQRMHERASIYTQPVLLRPKIGGQRKDDEGKIEVLKKYDA